MTGRARLAAALLAAAAAGSARAQTMLDQEERLIDIHSLLLDLPPLQAPGALAPGRVDASLEGVAIPAIDGTTGTKRQITASDRTRVFPRPRVALGLPAPRRFRAFAGLSYIPPVPIREVATSAAAAEAGIAFVPGALRIGVRAHALWATSRAPVTDPATRDVLDTRWLATQRSAAAPLAQARVGPAPKTRGVLDDTIVLGMVASFSGSNKERGRAMRTGWETAIAEVNAAGGIEGRQLKLVTFDDGYDPAKTLPAMKEAVETQGAFAVVGNVGTATAAVAIPYCAQQDAVFFGALSGADLLRKTPPDRLVFNFRAGLAREAAAAVKYLVEVRRTPAERIAVLAQDDDFGASGRRGAIRQLGTYGVAEADVLSLGYPRNTADVRDAVAKLHARAKDVDAVVMVATYKPAATFVRKAKDAGLDQLFFTTVSADSNGLAEELVESGARYTDGVLLTQVVPVPTSHASTLIRYREALEKYAPGEKPGSTSLEAWIGAQVFVQALRRAGRDLDTAKLVAALEGIHDWDIGIGAPVTFGPGDHQGSDMVWGWLLQPDGTYRQVALE